MLETPVAHPLATAAHLAAVGVVETTGIEPVVRPKSKRRPGLTRRKAKPDAIPVDEGGRLMPDLIQGDELESLDIENRKLKTLLLEKIREENA
ncbi:hypothetical protein ASG25_10135 [Rhizobium sp. Leaf384]|uniref:hypothetical protein n=1 Tax=unclassified Rhizobium TaxID=2613769 RepID=UPI000714D668|nr:MULTISPECIES: hypothetical protein [unclassified Rhizobium]KQS78949.1 hypothetical protein ASG25_10135 [Rhizobium sp. Leaf384]KQS82586.1 hypothetical protein ASG58_04335 [Rhizobium sp. Leaf383]